MTDTLVLKRLQNGAAAEPPEWMEVKYKGGQLSRQNYIVGGLCDNKPPFASQTQTSTCTKYSLQGPKILQDTLIKVHIYLGRQCNLSLRLTTLTHPPPTHHPTHPTAMLNTLKRCMHVVKNPQMPPPAAPPLHSTPLHSPAGSSPCVPASMGDRRSHHGGTHSICERKRGSHMDFPFFFSPLISSADQILSCKPFILLGFFK